VNPSHEWYGIAEFVRALPAGAIKPGDVAEVFRRLDSLDRLIQVDDRTGQVTAHTEEIRASLEVGTGATRADRILALLRSFPNAPVATLAIRSTHAPLGLFDGLRRAGVAGSGIDVDLAAAKSASEIQRVIQGALPDVPTEWFDQSHWESVMNDLGDALAGPNLRNARSAGPSSGTGACLIRHLGFWVFLTIVGVFSILAAIDAASGGTLTGAMVAAVIAIWGAAAIGYAYWIVECINHPSA